jgi:PAS domain S-box-containing protein
MKKYWALFSGWVAGTRDFIFRRSGRLLILIIAGGAVTLCVFTILFLASAVVTQIEKKSTSESDQVGWNLAQLEVELLALHAAISSALLDPESTLDDPRLRFDIFYARVNTVAEGAIYQSMRTDEGIGVALDRVTGFIKGTLPAMDLPDPGLRNQLETIREGIDNIRPSVREIALKGVRFSAAAADNRRVDFMHTLQQLALLTVALIVVLFGTAGALTILSKANARRANVERVMRERFGAIIENSLDAIIVVDSLNHIAEFNHEAQKIFGYDRDKVIGRPADQFLREIVEIRDDGGIYPLSKPSALRQLVGKGVMSAVGNRRGSVEFPVELAVTALPHWLSPLFAIFVRDVTTRHNHEEQLRQARDQAIEGEKAKEAMLLVMSHELRTPLNGLLGTLQLLEDTQLDAEQSRLVEVMRSSGEFLMEHVNDVLDVSQMDAGKMVARSLEFGLQSVLRDVVANQHSLALGRGNRLELIDKLERDQFVKSDPRWLRQIVLNLVSNANKFTEGGDITITLDRDAGTDWFRISVKDSGVGIAPENVAKIFKDFVTIDPSYERTAGGTGLGLGIVRRLVHKLGGKLSVDSKLGHGSAFIVELPLEPVDPSPAILEAARASDPQTGTERSLSILIVEDNAINRFVLREMLTRGGHVVTEAHDGAQAVEKARSQGFDLILMDISMPRKSGITALREIRAEPGPNFSTPVVALTAHVSDPGRLLKSGMAAVLLKPVSRSQMLDTIGAIFDAESRPSPSKKEERGPVLDDAHLQELLDVLGPKQCFSMLDKYLYETEQALTSGFFAEAGNPASQDLAARAHSQAGSAATFGLVALRNRLVRICETINAGDTVLLPRLMRDLEQSWAETKRSLRTWRAAQQMAN